MIDDTGRMMVAAVMTMGVIGLVAYGSRLSPQWIWRHAGTYRSGPQGMEGWVDRLPFRGPARTLVKKGALEARRRTAAGFMNAQSYGTGAVYLAAAPLALAIGAAAFGIRKLLTRERRYMDLDRGLVRLDLDNVAHVGFEVPEARLPMRPHGGPMEWTPEEQRKLRELSDVAAKKGTSSMAVSRMLAEESLASARKLRRSLRQRTGLRAPELAAYEAMMRSRGVRRWVLFRRMPRGHRRAMLTLAKAGVPVALLQAREAMRARGELTPLRERLFGILAAHPEHPASIDHHGADPGGLCEHTAQVVMRGVELIDAGEIRAEDEAAYITVLLAHDVGKTVSFQASEGGFRRVDGLHAQNSGAILRALPEFQAEHGEDAERVMLAVSHEHDREAIPLQYSESCGRLIDALLRAEGASVGTEGASKQAVEEALAEALRRTPEIVKNLNINRTGGGSKPDGVYEHSEKTGSVLLILEAKFRDDLGAVLSKEARQALGFNRRRRPGKAHPGWLTLAGALAGVGAIPKQVRGVPLSEDHLVSTRLGKVVFRGMFPLSLGWLRSQLGNELVLALESHWAVRQDFAIGGIVTGVTPSAVAQLRRKGERRAA